MSFSIREVYILRLISAVPKKIFVLLYFKLHGLKEFKEVSGQSKISTLIPSRLGEYGENQIPRFIKFQFSVSSNRACQSFKGNMS